MSDYSGLRDLVRTSTRIDVGGWRKSEGVEQLDLSGYRSVLDVSRADQTATFQTGINLEDLAHDLGLGGELGIPYPAAICGFDSVADLLSMDPPNPFGPSDGRWRDWVTGMKIMLADGSIVQSGSKVVKSVSGFDLHKLMIGSRFTLGIPLEVSVRLTPSRNRKLVPGYEQRIAEWMGAPPRPEMIPLMRRAKQLFDPTKKLNPGEFSFL